jgi:hypothetical protein
MSVCLLHVYDVVNADNDSTSLAVLRLNAIGRFTTLGGVFHGGIEVNQKEWSYGFCERGTGVYSCKPRDNPMYSFRETITLGATTLSESEVNKLILELKERWTGARYEVLTNNCNHFCQEFTEKLGVNSIPGWVNRMASTADAVTSFGAQTAEQVRWLHSSTAGWFNSWAQANPEATPPGGPPPQPKP